MSTNSNEIPRCCSFCKLWDGKCNGRYDNSRYAELWRSCELFENKEAPYRPTQEILDAFREYGSGRCYSMCANWFSQPRPEYWILPQKSWEERDQNVIKLRSMFPEWRFQAYESVCNNVISPVIWAYPPNYR